MTSYRSMSRRAYTSGVVIMECGGCKGRHLIADHYGWFGTGKTIEEIARLHGDTVTRIDADGSVSLLTKEDSEQFARAFESRQRPASSRSSRSSGTSPRTSDDSSSSSSPPAAPAAAAS